MGGLVRAHQSAGVAARAAAGIRELEPVWESEHFDAARWDAVESTNDIQLRRLVELRADYVVGTRPVCMNGRRLNQAYLWSANANLQPLRSKYYLPEEPGSWEATWFHKGDPAFPCFAPAR
jgi:N-carbamoylputrescine amidase